VSALSTELLERVGISVSQDRIGQFCSRWGIVELALFGSALRDDFDDDSDIDLLISFSSGAQWSLLDLIQMEDELAEILGRPVDLITRRSIERSRNWIRRREILGSARPLYAA
jgi:hypothetical protein